MKTVYLTIYGLSIALLLFACTDGDIAPTELDTPNASSSTQSQVEFRNLDAAFVGEEACASCHEDIVESYQGHGMANSMSPVSSSNVPSADPEGVYHKESDFYYEIVNKNGQSYQLEYRLVNGKRTHELEYPMDWVVGSGNAAYTYLTSVNKTYYQLPLTWYRDENKWAMSPGYEIFNQRFGRRVPDRCIACHNAYPEKTTPKIGQFSNMPEGIGCERCHGPGSLHVEERLTNPESPAEIDLTIVNPAHLSFDRRMDVCQQCHLNADVSLLKDGVDQFGFRPSFSFEEQLALFSNSSHSDEDVAVISHVERMKKSDCFVDTQNGPSPLECISCHNPHEGFRDKGPEYFNDTCIACHNSAEKLVEDENHSLDNPSNCISCHMPKVNSAEVVHSSFTDHWIRVIEGSGGQNRPVEKPTEVFPYLVSDDEGKDIYEGVAYLISGKRTNSNPLREEGLRKLKEVLNDSTKYGDAHYQKGLAHLDLEQYQEAERAFTRAVQIDPNDSYRLNGLAQAYEALGRSYSAITKLYQQALRLNPDESNIRTNYARYLESNNRTDQAIAEYQTIVSENPNSAKAQFNLGTAFFRKSDFAAAEKGLLESIKLDPDYSEALGNLGILLASQNQIDDAEAYFARALEADPQSSLANANLGSTRLNQGRFEEARTLLNEATRLDPNNVDALTNLAILYVNLNDPARAQQYIREALRIAPGNPRVQQVAQILSGS